MQSRGMTSNFGCKGGCFVDKQTNISEDLKEKALWP